MLSRSSIVHEHRFARVLTLFLAGVTAVACGAPAGGAGAPLQDVTIPAGTTLSLRMTSSVWSDTSRANDPVSADLIEAVTVEGRRALPIGTTVSGVVTSVQESGRADTSAHLTIQFRSLETGGVRYDIRTESFSKPSGVAADQDVRIGKGADVTTRLTAPLTVQVAPGPA